MSRNRLILLALGVAIAAGVVALVWSRTHNSDSDAADVTLTASVTVAPVEAQALQTKVSAYGVVQADPSASQTLAAPRAVIVSRVLVRVGQPVSAGQGLIEIADTPASSLAYAQAMDAAKAAHSDLARVQRLYAQHLAATDQLTAAQKAVSDADAGLSAQNRQGAGRGAQVLHAPAAAIITSIPVAVGDHAAQDAPLIAFARDGALVARLGLEPSSGRFQIGQSVTLRPVAGGDPIVSRLSMVGRTADPATRTLDAIAPLNGAALPVGAAVDAEIVVGASPGLTAPRASVVFDETGAHVFVVEGGKARRVFVTVGADQDDRLAIGGDLKAGDQVAVRGAYELEDGMAVKVSSR